MSLFKGVVLCSILFFLTKFAFAFSPNSLPNYYPENFVTKLAEGRLKDQALKLALNDITAKVHIKRSNARDSLDDECPESALCEEQITSRSYREAREILFGSIHLESTNQGYVVRDVYCEDVMTESDGVGPNQIPDHTKMNCEHTWPQSRFSADQNQNAQLTDLHHLYPANSRANSSRGNHIFADVNGRSVNDSCLASKRGQAMGSSEIAFEPPAEHKGDVARALFYFSVRYKHPIGPLEEQFLKRWHRQDPVDAAERLRHDKVYESQKNRNPFIDSPELVNLIRDF